MEDLRMEDHMRVRRDSAVKGVRASATEDIAPAATATATATAAAAELGVLLVHGIGTQKRSDTMDWAGDRVFKWLSLWYNHGQVQEESLKGPYLEDTRLVLPLLSEKDAPPFTHLRFPAPTEMRGDEERQWIIAESWWADDFLPPTYRETVHLALNLAPWLIEQTGFRIIGDLFDEVVDKEGSFGRLFSVRQLSRILDFSGNLLYLGARGVVTVIGAFLLLVLGVIAQVVVLALLILAFFPPLRNLVVNVQLALAGWLGDAYVMAVSPVRFNAMASRVQRDVNWLYSTAKCKSVAVVAHSGGAVVAHEALARPGAPGSASSPVLLVTYGSGQSKVNTIRKIEWEKNWFYNWSPVLRFAGVASVVAGAVLLVGGQDRATGWWLLLGGVALNIIFWLLGGRVLKDLDAYKPPEPVGNEWIDYRAVADIVPDQPITAEYAGAKGTGGRKGAEECVTEQSHNLNSLLQDHGAYWQNGEEFVPEIVRLLHAKATGRDLATSPDEVLVLQRALVRRQDRVRRYLAAGLLLLVSIPLIWMLLGSRLETWLGAPVWTFLLNTFTGANLSVQAVVNSVPTSTWNFLVGVVAVVVLAVLFKQFVLGALWKGWELSERDAMFERKVSDQSGECRRHALAFAFASALLPVVTFVFVAFQYYIGARTGFIESVSAIRATIEDMVRSLPVPGAVAGANWVQSNLEVPLAWVIIVLAGCIAVTSLVNFATTMGDLSSAKLSGKEPIKQEVFDRVFLRLAKRAPEKAAPALVERRFPVWLVGQLGRIATGRVVLGLLAVSVLVSISFQLVGRLHGTVMSWPDGKFIYTAADAYRMVDAYGNDGRQLYLWNAWTLDLVFPALYGLLGSTLILYFVRKARVRLPWRGLALIPFLGSAFDYLENIAVTAMIITGGSQNEKLGFGEVASVLTPTKWILDGITILLVLVIGAWCLFSILRRSPTRQLDSKTSRE